MKYCKNCGRQLQEDELCNCSNASMETSETVASTEEGVVTETYDYFNSDSEVSTTPETEESMNQGGQTFQNNDTSQDNQDFQGNATGFTQAGPSTNQKTSKSRMVSTAIKNVFPFIKAFVKTPSSALHISAENTDLPLAGIFYAVYCVSWTLFQVFAFSKLYGLFSSYFSYLVSFGQTYIKISYPYVILTGLIISLLFVIITNLFMIFLGFITHSKYKFKQIVAASSGIFVFPAISLLLATIFLFISLPISICLLAVGNVAYLLLFFYTGKTIFQKNDNSPYLWIMILLTATLLIITTLTSLKISLSFSSKMVRTTESSYDFFGNESYDDYGNWDDFNQFFE